MPIKRNSGFTIIEILVSVVIMSIIALGLMSMQTSFSQSLTSRQISSALTDVSNSQMARCKAGLPIENLSEYQAEAGANKIRIYTIHSTSGADCNIPTPPPPTSPPVPPTACKNVTLITSTGNITLTNLSTILNKNKSITISSNICYFK